MSPRTANPPSQEFVILGLIRLQPTHGYDLLQTLQHYEGIGLIWRIKSGQLYNLLEKLENNGWLAQTTVSGDSFIPRKVYRLTPAGEDAFQGWLRSPVTSAHRVRQDFLARLFFAAHESPQITASILSNQRLTCLNWLDNLQQAQAALQADQTYERLVFTFRIGQVSAMLQWIEECQRELAPPD